MKKWIAAMALGGLMISAAQAQQFTLKGSLTAAETPEKAYLYYVNEGERVIDSTDIEAGKFTLTNKLSEPGMATLRIKFKPATPDAKVRYDMLPIFMDASTITVVAKDSLKFGKVSGSATHAAYESFAKLLKPYEEKSKALNGEYMDYRTAKDTAGMDRVIKAFDDLDLARKNEVYKPYLAANPKSPIALYILNQYAGYDIDPKEIEPLFENLSPALKESKSGVAFADRINIAKKTAIGAYAINFTQNDTLGKPVSLADFKGKYVLVDFWASWCGPCRAENPNVVKAFKTYKDKGFTVLGVSLDQPGKHEAWMKAIHADDLTWTHVSDLKYWENEVAKQYGIRAIPQNVLVGPDGKIVAKNIRGEELNKTLSSFMN